VIWIVGRSKQSSVENEQVNGEPETEKNYADFGRTLSSIGPFCRSLTLRHRGRIFMESGPMLQKSVRSRGEKSKEVRFWRWGRQNW